MTISPRRALLGVLCGLLAVAGCAGRGADLRGPVEGEATSSGLYRVTIRDSLEGRRRFRLLLFAELPDRLHGEILSPVGSVAMVFDGGGDRMAVTLVRDRLAFAGPARPEALERVFGVRLSLAQLVRGILLGETPPEGVLVTRAAGPGLPSLLVIDDGRRNVTLELKRLQPLRAAAASLGRGVPPDGLEVRPLSELSLYDPAEILPDGPATPTP